MLFLGHIQQPSTLKLFSPVALYLRILVRTPQKISIYLSIEDGFFLNHVNTADFILIASYIFFRGHGKRQIIRKRDYTPVYWDHYFEHEHDVKVENNVSLSSVVYR